MDMMNGETSQNTVTGGMFDGEPDLDWDEGEDIEGEEVEEREDAQKPEPEAKTPEKADNSDFLTVRYNKADMALTKEKAVELAQKGLNYDHVFQELQSYRDGPIGKAMKAYADAAGMSVEQYAQMMVEQQNAAAEKQALQELQEQYPEAPEELLKEHVRLKLGDSKDKAAKAAETKRQQEWAEALTEYPDIKPDNVPRDVHDAVANGAKPIDALRMHELASLRAKIAELTSAQEAKQKQDENRARSIGSTAGVISGEKAEDDFLAGIASRRESF